MSKFLISLGILAAMLAGFLLLLYGLSSNYAPPSLFLVIASSAAGILAMAAVFAMFLKRLFRGRNIFVATFFIAGFVVVLGVCVVGMGLATWCTAFENGIARRTNLALNETDHARLLEACREMIKDPERYQGAIYSSPMDLSALPEVVRNLNPFSISLDNSCCTIAMTWELHRFYMVAFAADDPENSTALVTFKLRPGLWFYEEDGPIRGVKYPPGYPK